MSLKRFPVIAIDGPAGAGKTTVAKLLAERLGITYINTGAMYRAVALVYKRKNGDPVKIAQEIAIRFRGERIFLGNEDVTNLLYTPEMSMLSSTLSAIPGVRRALVPKQREMANYSPVVMEGRDIGTVVFPDADVKFFLTASVEERAKRRKAQFNDPRPLEEIKREISERDEQDSTRENSPLKPAEDAIIVDTTGVPLEQVVEILLREIEKKKLKFN
ncbi:MAG: (d)CMP kinase [Candidatus Aminicenantes bacterium]|nr:(d)CMP kinase [Candidatus Aminicenantes bacterium]